MSPEPFVSCAKALPAKRSEKGHGDENVLYFDVFFMYHSLDVKVANEQHQ